MPVNVSPRQKEIDRVLAQRLMHGAPDAAAIDALCARHPDLEPELGQAARAAATIAMARDMALERAAMSDTSVEPHDGQDDKEFRLNVPGYKDSAMIARGGQGAVYRATQVNTGRTVAIKVLWAGMFASASERARFDRESDALTRLDHPYIVRITDRNRTRDGLFYFIMDYVEGEQLDDYLANRPHLRQDGAAAMALFRKIADAIQAAHEAGVIHRDLKPSNIRIDARGNPRLLDFGLAHVEGDIHSTATKPGQFVGSMPWVSPEQAQGKHDQVDARSDMYSLALLLYHIATGGMPFNTEGSMLEVLHRITNDEPLPARRAAKRDFLPVAGWLDQRMEAVLHKALAKRPVNRYESVTALVEALDGKQRDSEVRRPVWPRWLVSAAALVILAIAAFIMFQSGSKPATTVPDERDITKPIGLTGTEVLGGDGGRPFEERAQAGQRLAGLRVWMKHFSQSDVICGIQVIYHTSEGIVESKVIGRQSDKPAEFVVPPNHVITALRLRYGQRVDAIQIHHQPDGASDSSAATSPWLGGPGGENEKLVGQDRGIGVGIHGRVGDEVDAIGMILAD